MFGHKRFDISRTSGGRWLALGFITFAIAAAIFLYLSSNTGVNGSSYQLVKLSNGESYIGRLSGINDDYATLNTPFIYKEPSDNQNEASGGAEIELLRVSSVDGDLRISTDKIVYWGNLPKEGKVVNAIKSIDE